MKNLRTLIAAAALIVTLAGAAAASLPASPGCPTPMSAPAADKGSDGQETHG